MHVIPINSTYDSHSKRWGKYTSLFKDFRLKKSFMKCIIVKIIKAVNIMSLETKYYG